MLLLQLEATPGEAGAGGGEGAEAEAPLQLLPQVIQACCGCMYVGCTAVASGLRWWCERVCCAAATGRRLCWWWLHVSCTASLGCRQSSAPCLKGSVSLAMVAELSHSRASS